MNEQDILDLIKKDENMMNVLWFAEKLNLPDWMIGAGFVRNKVWDYLHGVTDSKLGTDVDLVYFDPNGNNEKADEELSKKLKLETGLDWEVVNEVYSHAWKNFPPYISTEDSLSYWTETATAVAVKLEKGELKLIAPCGIDDLVNLIVRANPKCPNSAFLVKERAAKKKWLEKWPKLKVVL